MDALPERPDEPGTGKVTTTQVIRDNTGLSRTLEQGTIRERPLNQVPALQLYLASASPRRFELLTRMGLQPLLLPQKLDETWNPGEPADTYVLRLAQAKAEAGLRDPGYSGSLPLLAADTAVVCNGMVLGKPGSLADATGMLRALSGRMHEVMTAVVVGDSRNLASALSVSKVYFRELAEDEIAAYWASGEPRDKAGSYAIQGRGAMFVSRLEGSYSGVVGLPVFETMQLLARFGMDSRQILKGEVNER